MTPPLDVWEDELARVVAHRMVARACARLAEGSWDSGDLGEALVATERRLTGAQVAALHDALRRSRRLRELTAPAG